MRAVPIGKVMKLMALAADGLLNRRGFDQLGVATGAGGIGDLHLIAAPQATSLSSEAFVPAEGVIVTIGIADHCLSAGLADYRHICWVSVVCSHETLLMSKVLAQNLV